MAISVAGCSVSTAVVSAAGCGIKTAHSPHTTSETTTRAVPQRNASQAQGIIAKGKDDVVELRAGMEKDVRRAAVDIAEAMPKQLLSQVLSPADQHKLIQKHIKELEKVNA